MEMLLATSPTWAITAVRVALGVIFFAHGSQKVFGWFGGYGMIGAIATVHWAHGFFINWELTPGKGHGFEANLAFVAMAVACVIAGGGALSLDALLAR